MAETTSARAVHWFHPKRSTRRPLTQLRLAVAAGAAVAAMSFTAPARASIAYAYMLATAFDFGKGCQACHTDDAGGLGTVTKPFGKTLMKYGLRANDTSSLEEAVTQLSLSDDDSDGDTIADFDELAPDGDPNDPAVFPAGATPIAPTPSGTAPTPPVATSTTPPSTTPPSATPTTTTPPATDPPATAPSPPTTPSNPPPSPTASPAATTDGGGCGVAGSNVSGSSSAGVLALLALVCLARRRR